MINIRKYDDLGRADYGWLKARYHFSFGEYHDPAHTQFGILRVINDDIVDGGKGFDPHPHRDMEIVTYVRSGAISHEDSLGNKGRTAAGDVQVMSAGSGVVHAEYNREDEKTTLYQIWLRPRERGIKPRWDATTFPKNPVNDRLPLLVSGNPADKDNGALFINADADIRGGRVAKGVTITQDLPEKAYLLVSTGELEVNGHILKKGDGAAIDQEKSLTLKANDDSEVLLIGLH